MTDDEHFLSRWSRRKQEVADEAQVEKKAPREQDKADKPEPSAAAEAPAIDLSKLPALDDITAETDISGFLQKGVPSDLAHAALRRAWTSDPAIRDFVGLQENDWVFNKPGPEQGFGPLDPTTDVGKLLAQVFGESPKEEPISTSEQTVPTPTPTAQPSTLTTDDNPAPGAEQNDASHNKIANKPGAPHGGALPRPVSQS